MVFRLRNLGARCGAIGDYGMRFPLEASTGNGIPV